MGKPAIYLRVSSEIQKEKESIKSQEMALTAWLATQGLTPDDVGWYRDDGVSGKEPILGRGDGARLAEDIRAGVVTGMLIVFSISRISRTTSDYHQFREFLREHNINLIGAAEGVDTRNESGEFVAGVHALLAEEHHRTMLKAIRSGKERTAKQGKWQGVAPFGYRVEEGRLEIDHAAAPIVRQMYSWYLSGLGAAQIIARLEAQGTPGPQGEKWYSGAIRVILTNPAYKGAAAWNRVATRRGKRVKRNPKSEHISIPCPAIIDRDDWERAQQLRATGGRRFDHTGGAAASCMLTRVRCLRCGAPYNRATYSSGRFAPYYRHSRYPHKAAYVACPSQNISARELDRVVWEDIEAAISDPAAWRDSVAERHRKASIERKEARQVEQFTDALKRVEARLERLDAAYLADAMPLDRYKSHAAELERQRAAAAKQLGDLEEQIAAREQSAGDAATLAEVMKEYAEAAVTINNPRDRRIIAERLIAQVRVECIGNTRRRNIHFAIEWQRA